MFKILNFQNKIIEKPLVVSLYDILHTIYEIHPTCSTIVESSLQIGLFMQNKANFRKSQVNVNPYNTKDYENISDWTLGENKPNSKPIKANLPEGKIDAKCVFTKDYEEKFG